MVPLCLLKVRPDYIVRFNDLFQDVLNEDMPELREFQPPQPQSSDISIELQIPAGLAEVRLLYMRYNVCLICTQ